MERTGQFVPLFFLPIPPPPCHMCVKENATLPVGGCDPMLSHPPAPSTLSQHHHHHHQLLPTVLGSPRVSLALLPLEECACVCALVCFFSCTSSLEGGGKKERLFFLLSKNYLPQNFGSRQTQSKRLKGITVKSGNVVTVG
jgi:hypothetical protein